MANRKKSEKAKPVKKATPGARDGFNSHHVREPDKILDPKTGRTRLIDALLKDDMAQVEKLLKAGASANKATKDGKTPLHYAARLGMPRAITLLLDYGAKVNAEDANRQTPMFDALSAPQPARVLNPLLKAGADADLPDKDGRIPLHTVAETATTPLLRKILKHTENPNRPDKKGTQPLHLAAAHNSVAVVQTILFERVALFSADHNGDTALHHAVARKDSDDVAEYLLKTDAARMVNAENLDGRTPLHLAAAKKNRKLLQQMIDAGGDVNLPDRQGFTPLHDAICSHDVKTVKLLIDNGADISKPTARMRVTPLILAIQQKGDAEIVRLLLEHDASAKTADDDGVTPLMVAARNGDLALMQVLLETGADAAATDKRKQNVLHYCEGNIPAPMVEKLINGGADVNQTSEWGRSPLVNALQDRNTALATLLIDKGANPNVADNQGFTPLHIALQQRSLQLVGKLLEKGADVKAVASYSKLTPLHMAAQMGLDREVGLLLDKGADPTAVDNMGRTPLHNALQNGFVSTEAVRKLLAKGADPLQEDKYGTNAYDMAHNMRKTVITELFKQHQLKKSPTPYKPKPPRPPWGYM